MKRWELFCFLLIICLKCLIICLEYCIYQKKVVNLQPQIIIKVATQAGEWRLGVEAGSTVHCYSFVQGNETESSSNSNCSVPDCRDDSSVLRVVQP